MANPTQYELDFDDIGDVDPDGHIKYLLSKVKARNAPGTYRMRRTDILDFASWLADDPYQDAETITDVDAMTIGDYIDDVAADGYAESTVERRYDSVRMLYSRLTGEYGVMEEDPFEHLTKKKFENQLKGTKKGKELAEKVTYVTEEEKEQIADAVEEPTLRNELIVRILWQTGARRGELANMRLDKIDRDRRAIEVENIKKNDPDDPTRTVFYQSSLDFLLNQWIDGGYRDAWDVAAESPYLFVGGRNEHIRETKVGEIVKQAAIDAGVNEVVYEDAAGCERWRIGAHELRHGHAVHAIKSGIDVRTLQAHLGHSSLEMTMVYLDLVDEDVREAYKAFGD